MNAPISRRNAVPGGTPAVAGATVLAGYSSRSEGDSTKPGSEGPVLDISQNRIAREAGGLRPFRPSGFLVSTEQIGSKTVIHNYGHGGCGVTLSWGTAKMALDLALETPHRTAAVLGCGVIGLTTARLLQDHGFQVEIYAAALPPETTSSVAAGVFGVTDIADDVTGGPFLPQLQAAARYAHRYFQTLVGHDYGVNWFTLYRIGDEPIVAPPELAATPELYPMTQLGPGEHPFSVPYAVSIPAIIAETNVFLPKLMDDVMLRGGGITVREFASTDELESLAQPLVVNCTGLGAKDLFGDTELTPIKGQILLTPPEPALDYGYIDSKNDLYMFPRSDGVVFGGSREIGETNPEPVPAVAKRIVDGAAQILSRG